MFNINLNLTHALQGQAPIGRLKLLAAIAIAVLRKFLVYIVALYAFFLAVVTLYFAWNSESRDYRQTVAFHLAQSGSGAPDGIRSAAQEGLLADFDVLQAFPHVSRVERRPGVLLITVRALDEADAEAQISRLVDIASEFVASSADRLVLRVVKSAPVEAADSGPGFLQIALIAFLTIVACGVGLFTILVFGKHYRTASVGRVQELFGDALIAQLPEMHGKWAEHPPSRQQFFIGFLLERIRNRFRHAPGVICVSGALPYAGKTSVSFLCAAHLSRYARVAWINCDVAYRVDRVSHVLKGPARLVEMLGSVTLLSLACPKDARTVDAASKLVNGLKSQYDFIVLDTGPSEMFPENYSIAGLGDYVIFVIGQQGYSLGLLQRLARRLKQSELSPHAVVINRSDLELPESGYAYYGYSES